MAQPYPTPYDPNSGIAPERPVGFVENFGSGTGPYPGCTFHTDLVIEKFVNYVDAFPMTATPYSYNPVVSNTILEEPVREDWLSVP